MDNLKEKLNNIILIPCSGSEYHGELARQVAIQLAENSIISPISSMTCSTIFLKNVLLGKEALVEISKNHLKNSYVIIINGCNTKCASKIYEHLGIIPDLTISVQYLIPKQRIDLTDLNTFKLMNKISNVKQEDIEKVKQHVLNKLKEAGLNLEELEIVE
ncbi:MAG: putative zinc-binding protein [Promethearchaeota archaeon]